MGWAEWKLGAGGELKVGSSMHWSRKVAIVCLWRGTYTCQAEKVIRSSFTPSVTLLVHPSGTVYPTVDY